MCLTATRYLASENKPPVGGKHNQSEVEYLIPIYYYTQLRVIRTVIEHGKTRVTDFNTLSVLLKGLETRNYFWCSDFYICNMGYSMQIIRGFCTIRVRRRDTLLPLTRSFVSWPVGPFSSELIVMWIHNRCYVIRVRRWYSGLRWIHGAYVESHDGRHHAKLRYFDASFWFNNITSMWLYI